MPWLCLLCAFSALDRLRDTGAMPPKDCERFAKQLGTGWSSWEDSQRQAVITKASIQPLVKLHGLATKAEIQVSRRFHRGGVLVCACA